MKPNAFFVLPELNEKSFRALLILAVALGISACGEVPGGGSPVLTTPPAVVRVSLSPAAVGLRRGAAQQFTATVAGSSNTAVAWSVQEGPGGGSINSAGIYTAAGIAGIYHVVATAVVDASKTATSTVTVLQSGFTFTASLTRARLAHTATLLPTGKVLIVGGGEGPDMIDGFFLVAEAEIFDPLTGRFVSVGIAPRDFHTATLLLNGKVLVTGGEGGWTTAELYDSTVGLFQPTGSMATGRESHTATLLADGTVLVTGGMHHIAFPPYWEELRTAEVYNPVTGTFSPTGDMASPRVFHTATLLPNGKVLVTGGGLNAPLTTAELYDPVSGSFNPTGNMAVSRENHTATLLPNGKVLVVGGATAELYDFLTGLFTPAGQMTAQRVRHSATLLANGTVLIAGGGGDSADTATAEIYDPATASFTPTGSMGTGRFWHTATVLPDGSILVTGGATSGDGMRITVLNTAEIYK